MPLRPGQPLVTLDRAAVTLGGAPVLREVSLSLRAGDRVAVVGGNGSGKSTLLRLLRGDQWPDHRPPGRRTYHVPEDPQESCLGARERMALVGPEDQDAYARRDIDLTAEAVIRSGLDDALYPVEGPTRARAARVAAAAAAMGIGPLLRRSILTLSRGEARKVLVARALASDPDVLLLDEVCDGLDAAARGALLARLAAVAAGGTTVVTATHRAEEILPGVGTVVWLERGRVAGLGRPEEIVPRWEAALRGRVRVRNQDHDRGRGRVLASEELFRLDGVTVLAGGRPILDRVTWRLRRGEAWGVTGPNGSGKSTLLRLLAGEEQPARGTIRRLDLGERADAWEVLPRLGLVSPELQARHRLDATGEALVLSGFTGTIGLVRPPRDGERARAAAALGRLGLGRLAGRSILACSYGELRLLLLARALAPAPEALLLDEPFAGLDPGARGALRAALDRLVREGTSLVLVTHHEDEVPAAVGRRARLEAGRLAVDGEPAAPSPRAGGPGGRRPTRGSPGSRRPAR